MLFQVQFPFASFITEIALDFTTFVCHVNFQLIRSVEGSRTIFTFKCLLFTNALYHVRVSAIVGNCLITVFAVDFPVRVHVCAQFLSPLACLFALLASQLTIIMLCLNMQPQMLVSWNFNAAYGAGRHRQCKFSLNNYCQQFLISNMTIFLYQNETSRSVE